MSKSSLRNLKQTAAAADKFVEDKSTTPTVAPESAPETPSPDEGADRATGDIKPTASNTEPKKADAGTNRKEDARAKAEAAEMKAELERMRAELKEAEDVRRPVSVRLRRGDIARIEKLVDTEPGIRSVHSYCVEAIEEKLAADAKRLKLS